MKTHTISQLARAFGLSRSTLLYYDRIGLLPPYCRTASGYRCYNENDYLKLERICSFRRAGLPLKNIKDIVCAEHQPQAKVLEKRFHEITKEIKELKDRQRLLSKMFKSVATVNLQPKLNKELWVDMLRKAGMDEKAMHQWHAEFEKRAPEEHQEFLISLGIPEEEVTQIRSWSAHFKPNISAKRKR